MVAAGVEVMETPDVHLIDVPDDIDASGADVNEENARVSLEEKIKRVRRVAVIANKRSRTRSGT